MCILWGCLWHYNDVIMGAIASQITSLTIVYSTVYSDADKRKHQSPASLAFVRGIHRGPVNSPHKWPVTRKMLPFDDVIMETCEYASILVHTLCTIVILYGNIWKQWLEIHERICTKMNQYFVSMKWYKGLEFTFSLEHGYVITSTQNYGT